MIRIEFSPMELEELIERLGDCRMGEWLQEELDRHLLHLQERWYVLSEDNDNEGETYCTAFPTSDENDKFAAKIKSMLLDDEACTECYSLVENLDGVALRRYAEEPDHNSYMSAWEIVDRDLDADALTDLDQLYKRGFFRQ